ncbi:hypothetical protein BpHYR1_018640 [Brachionus plicatilis]|uniref:Uncharacterized protein n=1 Tax=Brachionus plicatilis TaxID=10195 RepID=A0A3M7PVR1_BRAPC|nr:hypothetical protein BpHYR1_018640 [Brachionus plicatilis]
MSTSISIAVHKSIPCQAHKLRIICDTPSKELKIARLPSVKEGLSDLNEACALNAILIENTLFEELKEEYEYLNDHFKNFYAEY